MKETLNVNIGTQAFVIDSDAYGSLKSYLDDIRSRLPEADTETIGDIELRFAEIFREKAASSMRVVTLEMVHAAMLQMGSPADFGERLGNQTEATTEESEPKPHRLYRSRTTRSIAGVCGGLAEFFNLDPTLIRLVMLMMLPFGGLPFWGYIILWIVIPEAPTPKFNMNAKKQ